MSREEKSTLFVQGMILAAAGIITKFIGFAYRIPMANILGDQGNGIYSVSFGIYNIALTLSSYSLPLAVSRMVSIKLAKKEYKNVFKVFRSALIFGIVSGLAACTVLFVFADGFETLYNRPGLSAPLRVLAPTTFVVAVLGVFRGFFQGFNNMIPTAISQIVEQVANAIVSVVAALQLTGMYAATAEMYSMGAAGGTLGTLTGAVFALLFFFFVYRVNRTAMNRLRRRDEGTAEPGPVILKSLVMTAVPVIISQTVYQVANTIDDIMFANLVTQRGMSVEDAGALQGVYNTQYVQLVSLPVAVATSMAASTIPVIVSYVVKKQNEDAVSRIIAVIKFNMVVAIPCAVGISVMGRPVVTLMFPSLSESRDTASMLLLTGSLAIVFYALSTITTAIIQSTDRMSVPMVHSAVSLGIHIALVYILMMFTDLGVYSLIIGNITFPMVVALLNMRSVKKKLRIKWNLPVTFGIPSVSSILMGVLCWAVYEGTYALIPINALSLVLAVAASVVFYAFLILKSSCFTDQELSELPMGGRLLRLSKKINRK